MLLLKMKCQQLDMFPQEPGKERIVGLDLADGWRSPLAAEKTEGVSIRRRGGGHRAREGGRTSCGGREGAEEQGANKLRVVVDQVPWAQSSLSGVMKS